MILYSCTHMATVGVKGLTGALDNCCSAINSSLFRLPQLLSVITLGPNLLIIIRLYQMGA